MTDILSVSIDTSDFEAIISCVEKAADTWPDDKRDRFAGEISDLIESRATVEFHDIEDGCMFAAATPAVFDLLKRYGVIDAYMGRPGDDQTSV